MTAAAVEKPAHPALKYLLLACLGLIWGTSFTFVGVAVHTVPPFTIASSRIILGGGILLTLALLARQPFPRRAEDWLFVTGYAVIGNAGPFCLLAFGQSHIDSSLAAILIAATPLFTLVIAHVMTVDEKISVRKGGGVAVGFVGILLLFGPAALGGLGADFWGQAMILGASLGFGISTVLARRLRHIPPMIMASSSLLIAGLFVIPLMLALEQPWRLSPSWDAVVSLGGLSIFSTACALIIFFKLIKLAGANFTALNNYMAPAVGVLWGTALLGEKLTWLKIGAIAVIFVGIGISGLRPRTRTPTSPAG